MLLLFASTVLLRFKPPVGARVAYTMTLSMSQNVPGMAGPMRIGQTLPMTFRVVSRKGADTTLETKTGRARVTVPAPMASGKARMEKAMSGLTTTAVIDERGNYKSAAGGAHAAMNRGMGSSMMAGAQGVTFPAKAVRPGDTWTASLDLRKAMNGMMGGGMKLEGKIPIVYRLVALERRGGKSLARIAMTMRGETSMNLGATKMGMTIDSTGGILVDTATGFLREMSVRSITDMSLGPAGQHMRQTMTMSMKAR